MPIFPYPLISTLTPDLNSTVYRVAIRPIRPAVTRKTGLIAKDKNTLPLASKYFIEFLFAHIEELA